MVRTLGGGWRRKAVAMFLGVSLFVGPAAAEDQGAEGGTVQLEEVTVVAPAIIEGNVLDPFSSQTSVVTQEQIEDLNAQDIPSALRRTPGVVISRHNPIGSFGGGEGGAIFIRGQGSSRPGAEIQTAVDGIPKFTSVWTHPLMDVLSVDVAQSIQVYKGAQPLLFGNMAFAVMDITTKRVEEEGFRTKFQTAYGSYDTLVEVLEHGGKVKALDYYLLGSYRSSNGHREDADGMLGNAFGRVGYELGKNWGVSLIYNYTNNRADDPGSTDPSVPSEGSFKTQDSFTVATLSNRYDWGEGYFKLYDNVGHMDWTDQKESTGLNTLTDYNNYGARARETIRPWKGGEVLLGMDLDYLSGKVAFEDPNPAKNKYFPEETWRILSPYTGLNHLFGARDAVYFLPSAGVRYLSHDQFEDEWAPQAGFTLGVKDTAFHAQYARGVNYPGIYVKVQDQIFMPGDNQWKNLKAETVNHYELGVSHTFNPRAKADVTYFYDSGRNRIVVAQPPPFPPVFKNVERFSTRGLEATVSLAPTRDLALFGGMTYLEATPGDLPYCPNWTASAGANYRFHEGLQLSVDALYVTEQFVTSQSRTKGALNVTLVDPYFLLNAKLTYDVPLSLWGLSCQAFLAGENLTNADYEQKAGYPMPGINGMVGLVFRIGS